MKSGELSERFSKMSAAASGIIDAIVCLLDEETIDIKEGRFAEVAVKAERKARLLHQLSKAEIGDSPAADLAEKLNGLRGAVNSNLRACRENIESMKELIALYLAVERQMENDGTYTIVAKRWRET
jgi:hypothetical protein